MVNPDELKFTHVIQVEILELKNSIAEMKSLKMHLTDSRFQKKSGDWGSRDWGQINRNYLITIIEKKKDWDKNGQSLSNMWDNIKGSIYPCCHKREREMEKWSRENIWRDNGSNPSKFGGKHQFTNIKSSTNTKKDVLNFRCDDANVYCDQNSRTIL